MLDEKDRELFDLIKAKKVMEKSKCKSDKDVDDRIASIKSEKEKPKGGKKGGK